MPSRIVAHRGAESVRPENTLEAFEEARRLGADAIEFDVHESKDGTLIVHHDFLLDRTTSGTGFIGERTSEYVRGLDAGSWFSPSFAGLRVPLLDEVLELQGLNFELELKGFSRSFVRSAVRTVRDHGAMEWTDFTSWNTAMLLALKSEHPDARICSFSPRREQWMPVGVFERTILSQAGFAEFFSVHVRAGDMTSELVAGLHQLNMAAHANDANTPEEMASVFRLKVDSVSTSDVAAAIKLRDASG